MPNDIDPVVIKAARSPFFYNKKVYLPLILGVLILIIVPVILIGSSFNSRYLKNQPKATPTPSPTPLSSKPQKLKNIIGLVKSVDLKNNSIEITHDKITEKFFVSEDTSIEQINSSKQLTSPNLKVIIIPTEKITLKDIKPGSQALLVLKTSPESQLASLQIYK